MICKDITIELASGLGVRPVAMLVQVASQYESNIYVENNNVRVNAKSIMGMMSLAFSSGESITVIAEGSDEGQAIESIEKYLSNN